MRRSWLVVVVVVMFAACSDDMSEPRTIQITGNYTLEMINGQSLPFTIGAVTGGYLLQQVSGSFLIRPDSTYREDALVRETIGSGVTDIPVTFNGRWQAQDSIVTVRNSVNGEMGFGFVSGNRLTLSFEVGDSLFTYLYRRN
jgi:hypothetical protein